MQELVGKTVQKILMADNDYIRFETDNGTFTYYAYGDCCSVTWIEHMDNPTALIGHKIISVEDRQMTEIDNSESDCLRIYGYMFRTDYGHCLLEFRNSSNGYYGGNMILASEVLVGFDFKEITEPF